MNEVVDPLYGIHVSYCLWAFVIVFQSLTASLIGQSGSFTLPSVERGTEIILLSQSTLTHSLK